MRRNVGVFALSLVVTLLALIVAAMVTDLPDRLFPSPASSVPSPAVVAAPDPQISRTPQTPRPANSPETTAPPRPTATDPPQERRSERKPGPRNTAESQPPATAPHRTQYTFPVARCEVQYAQTHHNYPAVDIFTEDGCTFVAPVSGTVDEVTTKDAWSAATNVGAERGGLSVSIVGVDGVRYYGSHLSTVADSIVPGAPVHMGQELGAIGETGSARGTGSHLHFGISWPTPRDYWWIRRGAVAPQPFLDAWSAGAATSPAAAVERARLEFGDDSRCQAYC